jgi:pyridoxal phosphate enzyme (YggS family)
LIESFAEAKIRIRTGLERVRERILQAADKVGRKPEDVRMVAVTKGRSLDEIVAVLEEGITDIGENRVAEGYEKWLALRGRLQDSERHDNNIEPTFHLIGHLQRNKVRRACEFARYLHSLDSLDLAKSIAARLHAGEKDSGCRMQVLVEVNVTREPQKHGIVPEQTARFLEEVLNVGLRPVGLMCMSRLGASRREHRMYFETLARLRDEVAREVDGGITELSMGMTDDFEEAVKAGATMVRIGRAIFEP